MTLPLDDGLLAYANLSLFLNINPQVELTDDLCQEYGTTLTEFTINSAKQTLKEIKNETV